MLKAHFARRKWNYILRVSGYSLDWILLPPEFNLLSPSCTLHTLYFILDHFVLVHEVLVHFVLVAPYLNPQTPQTLPPQVDCDQVKAREREKKERAKERKCDHQDDDESERTKFKIKTKTTNTWPREDPNNTKIQE